MSEYSSSILITEPEKPQNNEITPLVSIGLAVYNGDAYLEEAIESILAQTYTNFELIISDNASTDRTAEICKKYAEQDARIRYSRNATNIGGANNENLTFKLSKGKYFRWAAHDDVLAPELVEKCVKVLEENPEVVICNSITVLIDAQGQTTATVSSPKARSDRPSERFTTVTSFEHDCEESYGLMRSVELKKTGLQRNYTDSDRTLLAHMSLYGKFYELPEPLFYRRIHPQKSTAIFSEWRQRMYWFGDQYKNKITLPHWAQLFHYLSLIATAPISLSDKLHCHLHMVVWVASYRRWRSLGKDLVLAGFQLSRKLVRR